MTTGALARLQGLGFRGAGTIALAGLRTVTYDPMGSDFRSAVYAFEQLGEIKYFGQTAGSLKIRLAELARDMRRRMNSGEGLNRKETIFYEGLKEGPFNVWAKRPERTKIHGVDCELLEPEEIVLMQIFATPWNDRGQRKLNLEPLKGTVTVMPGVDLTQPACPEWADLVESPGRNAWNEDSKQKT